MAICGEKIDFNLLKSGLEDKIFAEITKDTWFILKNEMYFQTFTGSRITKTKHIGKGGFGHVFEEIINGQKVAVKCIDISKSFSARRKMVLKNVLDVSMLKKKCWGMLRSLFADTYV